MNCTNGRVDRISFANHFYARQKQNDSDDCNLIELASDFRREIHQN